MPSPTLSAFALTLLCALAPGVTHAQTVLQPDAAPPGASIVVSLIAANGGWTGSEVITTDCPEILIGPTWLSAGAGNPASPIANAVLTTVFFVLENAPPGDCVVRVNGAPLAATGAIDNVFSVVLPLPSPEDGGPGDASPAGDGKIVVPSSARSDGGVVVFSSLSVPAGVTLSFDKTDPVPTTGGNEAYMPIIVLVRGDAQVDGVIDASGEDGKDFGDNRLARSKNAQSPLDGGDGGHGGPGGGGGAAGGPHNATSGGGSGGYAGTGGDGFGGGSGSPSIVFDKAPGGAGVAFPPDGVTGGNSPFGRGGGLPATQVTCGGGGGSGNPYGIGGQGGLDNGSGGAGGYGGGGGANTSNSTSSGGGGGGFATAGKPGGLGQTNGGKAGNANGLPWLVPHMGGSGGGGGDGWITGTGPNSGNYGGGGGGGGGGALQLVVYGRLSGAGALRARGGAGGDAGNGNAAASGGGGGSGGAIFLAARELAFTGTVDVHGGAGGVNPAFGNPGGAGGEGRVRYDGGVPPTLTKGPTDTFGSTWQGCATSSVNDALVETISGTACAYVVLDGEGDVVASGTVAANATLDLRATFDTHGDLTVVLSRDNVPSPVGISRVVADSDGDEIPDFADADDDNDGLPDALEGDGDEDGRGGPNTLDLDSDEDGLPDLLEAYGPAFDLDLDGHPDDLTDADFDGLVAMFDLDDTDPTVIVSIFEASSSDADGVPDFLDLDSDGDGAFDLIEAGGVEPSLPDGRLDWAFDGDGDGLAAVVDPDEGGVAWPRPDTDGDEREDVLDVCGDGRVAAFEGCDAGAGNGAETCGCSGSCTLPGAETACDDGDFCTSGDRCEAGACRGGGSTCAGATPICDEANARCVACLPRAGVVDLCDGADADCDGATDEDFVAAATTCGRGRCAGQTGVTSCVGGVIVDGCDPFGGAVTESCNAQDDDCDGVVDDGAGCPALETALTATPDTLTAQTSTTFAFTNPASPTLTTFECRLDGGSWARCDGGSFTTGALADGSHTLLVRAIGPNGAVDATPAFHAWVIDTSVPETVIALGPSDPSQSDTATFVFEGGLGYECVLDPPSSDAAPTSWVPCDAVTRYEDLAEGGHTLWVRAVSPSGVVDPSPETWTWEVDTSLPDTRITSAPEAVVTTGTASFEFESPGEEGASFLCRLDGGAWAPCDGVSYEGLEDGVHRFEVVAVDAGGNVDPAPAVHVWTIDRAPPETTIVAGPDALTQSTGATFVFASEPGATFECALDVTLPSAPSPWVPCEAVHTVAGLAPGPHVLHVRARDAAGNVDPTPASHTWTIDLSAPETQLTDSPDGPLAVDEAANFGFVSGDEGATFECRLDDGPWAVCADGVSYDELAVGPHTFAVRACAGDRCDPTPATAGFVVSDSPCPRDVVAPTLDCAAEVRLECGVDSLDLEAIRPTPNDACGASLAVEAPEGQLPLGTSVIVFRAEDGNGNVASCLTKVVVADTRAPTLSCPEDVSLEADAMCRASHTPSATANDLCDGEPAVLGLEAGSQGPGERTVTLIAVDASGNRASCDYTVTVVDATTPSISCISKIEQSAPADACAWEGTVSSELTDNCATASALDETKAYPVGTTEVTFASGGASCVTDVVVNDVVPPTVSCDPAPAASARVALVGGRAEDACGVVVRVEDASCEGAGCAVEIRGAAVYAEAVVGQGVSVSYTVVGTDPSGNTQRVPCTFALDAAPEVAVGVVAEGGADCAGGGATGFGALLGLGGLGVLTLRRRREERA